MLLTSLELFNSSNPGEFEPGQVPLRAFPDNLAKQVKVLHAQRVSLDPCMHPKNHNVHELQQFPGTQMLATMIIVHIHKVAIVLAITPWNLSFSGQ